MVAISLYRGNLHKAPDAPRKWLMPRRNISLKDFKTLSRKRDKTLSSIVASARITTPPNSLAVVSIPNPNPNSCQDPPPQGEGVGDSGGSKNKLVSVTETCLLPQLEQNNIGNEHLNEVKEEEDKHHPKEVDELVLSVDVKAELLEIDSGLKIVDGTSQEVVLVSDQPTINVCVNVDLSSEKEKKKRELEEKLEVLNGRKHNLVQMLKQILNAEEEMKRRNNVLASVIRPPAPLQVETIDLGSPRQAVTRAGLDTNHCGDLEGESEDHSSHNAHVRNFQRMRSTSPSGSSPRRKSSHSSLQPNAVLYPPRTSGHAQNTTSMLTGCGIIASPSPSRFAPPGSAYPANLPAPISVSGTQFMASSPSPAASGGTSVFRDSRFASPS